MKRYAIVGSGALGGLYGAMLQKAGAEVHFLLRSDYDHVTKHGWSIRSIWGDFTLPNVRTYANADHMPACDVTIVATKTTANESLAAALNQPTSGGGVVLYLQNGLNIEQTAIDMIGIDRVLSGCCFLCSNKTGPGEINHLDQGKVVFGGLSNAGGAVAVSVADDFRAAGIPTETTADVAMVRWRKLMWNIPFNGLSVVLNASTDQIMASDAAVNLAARLIDEVHRGAASIGVRIPEHQKQKTLDSTRTMVPYDSSMRLDYLANRPMEIGAIFEHPIAAAAERMPSVEMLCDQLRFLDATNVR